MNEHDQPQPLEEELALFIERVRQDLERGARPSDVANWVHSHRLGTLKLIFIFMKATGVSLGDAKRMDRWWNNGVSDPDGFDQEARRLLAERAGPNRLGREPRSTGSGLLSAHGHITVESTGDGG